MTGSAMGAHVKMGGREKGGIGAGSASVYFEDERRNGCVRSRLRFRDHGRGVPNLNRARGRSLMKPVDELFCCRVWKRGQR